MTVREAQPLITSISVRELFGRRSYDIEIPEVDGKPSRLLLLHGDNGSGKTTLLRLVWHALSAADNRGHRSFIAKTPFMSLGISMTGGRSIHIAKSDGLLGSFTVTVRNADGSEVVAKYTATEDLEVRGGTQRRHYSIDESAFLLERAGSYLREISKRERNELMHRITEIDEDAAAEVAYLEFLENEVKTPLYLADDRSLYSDDPDINRMREMLWRRDDGEKTDRLARLAFNELQITIRRVNEHLRSLTIGGQNDGSANSNAIYLNVLRQLVEGARNSGDAAEAPVSDLLDQVAESSPMYEKYGLVPPLDTTELRRLLSAARGDLAEPAERIVSPFLSSLQARYEALSSAQRLLESLIPTVNSFLNEKQLHFTPRTGLRIVTLDGDVLEVEALSSGERQLLMLLCTTLLAGIDTNIFIVDEPELSLGVDWQRKILESLLDVTDGSNLQFLVATHSVEIISGNPESLVQLRAL